MRPRGRHRDRAGSSSRGGSPSGRRVERAVHPSLLHLRKRHAPYALVGCSPSLSCWAFFRALAPRARCSSRSRDRSRRPGVRTTIRFGAASGSPEMRRASCGSPRRPPHAVLQTVDLSAVALLGSVPAPLGITVSPNGKPPAGRLRRLDGVRRHAVRDRPRRTEPRRLLAGERHPEHVDRRDEHRRDRRRRNRSERQPVRHDAAPVQPPARPGRARGAADPRTARKPGRPSRRPRSRSSAPKTCRGSTGSNVRRAVSGAVADTCNDTVPPVSIRRSTSSRPSRPPTGSTSTTAA